MAILPIIGDAYESKAPVQNIQKTINWYLTENTEDHDGTDNNERPWVLEATPGLAEWLAIPGGVEGRAIQEHKNKLYAVVDNKFYQISTDKSYTELGSLSTSTGAVSIAQIDDEITLVDGTEAYHYKISTGAYNKIISANFPNGASTVTAQDQYFIVPQDNSDQFQICNLADGLTYDALDFATAESNADRLVTIKSFRRELWLFGEKVTEIWYNSGNATFPFERRNGVLIDVGCAAKFSVAQTDTSIIWLSKDERGQGRVVMATNYQMAPISTRAIDYQISTYGDISDARAYTYQEEGHLFYVITFPTAKKTWVYDVTTKKWHERQSENSLGEQSRHISNAHAFFNNKNLVMGYEDGKIYEMSRDLLDENGNLIIRTRRTANIHSENTDLSIYNAEFIFQSGKGLSGSGQGSDPQVAIRISKNGGITFGNTYYRSAGKLGEYDRRIRLNRLGQSRTWVFEIVVSDPIEWTLLGATADYEASR